MTKSHAYKINYVEKKTKHKIK